MSIEAGTESKKSKLDMLEEIILHFQPIELLFDVMGAANSEEQGVFVRKWAEIGMYMTASFREYIDQLALGEKK